MLYVYIFLMGVWSDELRCHPSNSTMLLYLSNCCGDIKCDGTYRYLRQVKVHKFDLFVISLHYS